MQPSTALIASQFINQSKQGRKKYPTRRNDGQTDQGISQLASRLYTNANWLSHSNHYAGNQLQLLVISWFQCAVDGYASTTRVAPPVQLLWWSPLVISYSQCAERPIIIGDTMGSLVHRLDEPPKTKEETFQCRLIFPAIFNELIIIICINPSDNQFEWN